MRRPYHIFLFLPNLYIKNVWLRILVAWVILSVVCAALYSRIRNWQKRRNGEDDERRGD